MPSFLTLVACAFRMGNALLSVGRGERCHFDILSCTWKPWEAYVQAVFLAGCKCGVE